MFSLLKGVIVLILACILLGCAGANPGLQNSSLTTSTPRLAPQATLSPTATLMVIQSPTWTLYQEPHHYFSLEYPSDWRVRPGKPPLTGGSVWSFSGLLARNTVTQGIEIGRDVVPIHSSQTIQAWEASKGPDELVKTILEQKIFQLNGREVYFEKASVVPQGAVRITYFRCGTWVWFVWSKVDETAAAAEFDVIFEHVVNTFIPKCG